MSSAIQDKNFFKAMVNSIFWGGLEHKRNWKEFKLLLDKKTFYKEEVTEVESKRFELLDNYFDEDYKIKKVTCIAILVFTVFIAKKNGPSFFFISSVLAFFGGVFTQILNVSNVSRPLYMFVPVFILLGVTKYFADKFFAEHMEMVAPFILNNLTSIAVLLIVMFLTVAGVLRTFKFK